jgi:hypothetical protein
MMNVTLDMSISSARLIGGEDAGVSFVITNLGDRPVTVRDPALDSEQPRLELYDAKGERLFAGGARARSVIPRAAEEITLGPGERASGTRSLTRWLPKLAPGHYTLVASIDVEGESVASAKSSFELEPLCARSITFAGPHAGHGTLRYALVQHVARDESVLLLSLHDFEEEHGHMEQSMCIRLPEAPRASAPLLSVSRNGDPFEGQWISWIESAHLRGLYLQPEREASIAIPIAKGLSAIGPSIVDLSGWDDAGPPSHELLVFRSGYAEVLAISARGELGSRASWTLAPGELEWGAATFRTDGRREAFVAVHHEGELRLEHLSWSNDATPSSREIGKLAGRVLGGALALDESDGIFGALVVRDDRRDESPAIYSLVTFASPAGGAASVESAKISSAHPIDFVRALVDVGPDGRAAALLHAVGGRWHVLRERTAIALADNAFGDREPVGCFQGPRSFAVLAGPEGLEYRPL